ncbi:MAG TPA: YggT family protein [Blastocatellia bacterium]|nr:YggT family protein [Blastocatellia bacterium]
MELIAILLFWLSRLIWWATLAVAGLLVLRVVLNWAGANPFSRVSYNLTRLTEPLVRPLRYQFGRRTLRFDLVPVVTAVLVLALGWSVAGLIAQLAPILSAIGNNILIGAVASRAMLGELIKLIGLLYVGAIFLRFLLPFFGVGYRNRLHSFLFVITEPVIKPLRRFFVLGTFDLAPIAAMIIIQLLTPFLAAVVTG